MLPEAVQAMRDLFATNLAAQGTFTPAASGVPVPVRIILGQNDPELVFLGGQTGRAPGYYARLRTAELPTRPRDGDALTIGAARYKVRDAQTDACGTSWVLGLEAAA